MMSRSGRRGSVRTEDPPFGGLSFLKNMDAEARPAGNCLASRPVDETRVISYSTTWGVGRKNGPGRGGAYSLGQDSPCRGVNTTKRHGHHAMLPDRTPRSGS